MGLKDVAVCLLGLCQQTDKFGDSGRSTHSDLMFSIRHMTKDLGFTTLPFLVAIGLVQVDI